MPSFIVYQFETFWGFKLCIYPF